MVLLKIKGIPVPCCFSWLVKYYGLSLQAMNFLYCKFPSIHQERFGLFHSDYVTVFLDGLVNMSVMNERAVQDIILDILFYFCYMSFLFQAFSPT